MKPTLTIDASGLTSFMRQMQRTIGAKTLEPVLKATTGKVLERCIKDTKSAKAKAYPRNAVGYGKEGDSEVWINAGLVSGRRPAGTVWLREPGHPRGPAAKAGRDGTYLIRGGHYRFGNERWARAQRILKIAEADARATAEQISRKSKALMKLKGRGLSKQSWVQIGDALQIPLKVPAYVRKATAQSGLSYQNGSAIRHASTTQLYYEIQNRIPTLTKGIRGLDGHSILRGAIAARRKAFEIEAKKKVLTDIAALAKRYPGLAVA